MIRFKWSRRGTCWWNNDWHPQRQGRFREDILLGVKRVYSRVYRRYAWLVIVGRLAISIVPSSDGTGPGTSTDT